MQRLDEDTQTQDLDSDNITFPEDKYSDLEDEYGDQGGFRRIVRTKPRHF